MTNGGDDHRVNLERKLPLYIVYFTTYVRDDALHFANDIYDRDDALVRALRGVAVPADSAVRGADSLRARVRALIAAE